MRCQCVPQKCVHIHYGTVEMVVGRRGRLGVLQILANSDKTLTASAKSRGKRNRHHRRVILLRTPSLKGQAVAPLLFPFDSHTQNHSFEPELPMFRSREKGAAWWHARSEKKRVRLTIRLLVSAK